MEQYQVRRLEPYEEAGVILDYLLLTPAEAEEVEAVLRAEYPGTILVKVCDSNYRRLTGKYTLP
jgi:hypothetical protein